VEPTLLVLVPGGKLVPEMSHFFIFPKPPPLGTSGWEKTSGPVIRTFEAHDLMLHNYFAVKFSPSGHVVQIRTNSVALQHRIRPRSKTTR